MKVLMLPTLEQMKNDESGIKRVIEAYHRYLPKMGVTFVHPDAADYDLKVVHAGATAGDCDVAMTHGLYFTADYEAELWEWYVNQRVIEAVRHAREVTVPSAWVAETYQRDMRFTPHVVPHGIEWQDWQHDEPKGDYVLWNKNRVGDVCDPSVILALAERFERGRFVTTFLPRGVAVPSGVEVIGVIPHNQMKRLVQSAAVYLATTKETFGIGTLEAMASGVPVLGYAHGGNLDLIQHGVNGYLARPDDVEDLAEGMRYCIKHRATLGANGRELARAWTWEVACEKVLEVFKLAAEDEPPTVSVVIPVYNKSNEEIERAVESAISQSYDYLTGIIVVDDGSKEEARIRGLIEQLHVRDSRIRLIRQSNAGVANARNRGIRDARSKYICCLDSDDWLAPNFLRVCIKALEADRSLGIAYTSLRWHKPDGTEGISQWPGEWEFDRQIKLHNQVPTACVFRRIMWERLGGYRQRYAPKGAGAEDAEFWLRSGAYGWKAKKVTTHALFHYSWQSGIVSGNPDYQEVDWTAWHPWAGRERDDGHPFASYATAKKHSHPVRQYDSPVVSVVIPVGPGHEKEAINALDSLEAQTFRQWEAIVVWDGPGFAENETVQAVEKAYPYAKFHSVSAYESDEGRGAGWARNFGVRFARGPFLLFLDADDWLYPQAIERMLMAWDKRRAIPYTDYVGKAFVGDPTKLAPDLRGRIRHYEGGEAVIGFQAAEFDCNVAMKQPEDPPYIWCNVTALVPRVWHDAVGGFDESMESWEDVDYHWRHARAGHCYVRVPEELMVYRFYTGGRRDRGLQIHENLVKYLRDKYEKDGDNVAGCGGCGGGGAAPTYRRPATPMPRASAAPKRGEVKGMVTLPLALGGTIDVNDSDLVKIQYSGSQGDHRVIGPSTGIDYKYHVNGDIFLVHKNDSGGRFQVLTERVISPPPAVHVATPPPQPLAPPQDIAPRQPMAPVSEPPQKAPPPPEPLEAVSFSPSEMTVPELREFVQSEMATPQLIEIMLMEEQGGKARKTALAVLEGALNES